MEVSAPSRRRRPALTPYLLTGPALLVLAFFAAAFVAACAISFTSYSFLNPVYRFAGLSNYVAALTSQTFWGSSLRTGELVVVLTTVEVIVGGAMAVLLEQRFHGQRLLRAIVLLPLMMPPIVAAVFWKEMMSTQSGILDYLLVLAHLSPLKWLGGQSSAFWSVGLIDVWINSPFVALLILAGFQALPRDVYEAAGLDGASAWQALRHITLPLVRPFLYVAIVFRFLGAAQTFDIIYATTQGGPGNATLNLPVDIYQEGFSGNLMAYAMAESVLFFVFIFMISQVLVGRLNRNRPGWAR